MPTSPSSKRKGPSKAYEKKPTKVEEGGAPALEKSRKVTLQDLQERFPLFLKYVWRHLRLPDPTPVQYEIAEFLSNGPDREIIEAFRGVGKSWIGATYCIWTLWKNPEEKILVISATETRAKDFTLFCQRLIIEIEFLGHLKATKEYHRWSKLSFDVGPANAHQQPSVKAVGISGQLAGSRASLIILDDVEIPNNSATQDARDKLIKAVLETEAILLPGIGRTKFLGTPQTEESIYNKLRDRGYVTRIWPARVPTENQLGNYQGCLAESIKERCLDKDHWGRPTDPRRFTDEDLTRRELLWGRSGFSLQFMLDTSLSDAERYPLKTSDLIVLEADLTERGPQGISWGCSRDLQIHDLVNVGFTGDRWHKPLFVSKDDWLPFATAEGATSTTKGALSGTVMAIDPSGRGKDETGYAIVSILHGRLFLRACGGLIGGYTEDVLNKLAQEARAFKVNTVSIEENFGQGMFLQLFSPVIRKVHPCELIEVRHSIQKERRIIDTLEPVLNQHRLVVSREVVAKDLTMIQLESASEDSRVKYSLFYQMTRLTSDRGSLAHDDRLDALAQAVGYWTELMSVDAAVEEQAYADQILEESIRASLDKTGFIQTSAIGGGGDRRALTHPFLSGLSTVDHLKGRK